jgi:hypothetical protein
VPDRPAYQSDLNALGERLESAFRELARDVKSDLKASNEAWRDKSHYLNNVQQKQMLEIALLKQDMAYLKSAALRVAGVLSAGISALFAVGPMLVKKFNP